MSSFRKKILGSIFNPLARLGRMHPIDLDNMYDLFTEYGADPAKQDIETLKKAMDKAVRDFMVLSKYVNPTRSENLFMDEFIALRIAVEEANPKSGYIYPHRNTVAELYEQRDGYMAMALHSKYLDASSTDINARIQKSQSLTSLQNLYERFETFFRNTGAKELSERLDPDRLGKLAHDAPDMRTWDLWLLNEGEVKIEIENAAVLVHSMSTYHSNPFIRKQNIRDALDRVIEWVETYGEASPALHEMNEAFINIQQSLNSETSFYDPRYLVISEESLFKIDEHAKVFHGIAENLRTKREGVDGMPPAGETFQSIADKLEHFGTAAPIVARNSMLTSARRPQQAYDGPEPPRV